MPRSRLTPRWLALLAFCLALGPRTASAVEPEVKECVERIEKFARDPFEQDQRERALRDLGKLGGTDAAAALVPLFEDPFIHLHDHAVSAWIAMLRGGRAAETQTWLTGRGLSDRAPLVRAGVAKALGLGSGAEIQEPLQIALAKEKDGLVLAALARAATRLRTPPDLGGVLRERMAHKDGEAAFELALAAAALEGADAVPALLSNLKHRSGLARAGAVLGLQQLDALPAKNVESIIGDKEVEPPMALAESLARRTQVLPWPGRGQVVLERLLEHEAWRVRVAAIQGALRLWAPEIVPLLIARLPAETGRIQEDVRRALETYTGKALGHDPELWTAWWSQNAGTHQAGPRPEPDHAGDVHFRAPGERGADPGTNTVAFFELPLASRRFAFVFDLSGSMRNAAAKEGNEGPTKLELLQAEVRKTLETLPDDAVFDIFVYRYWSEYPPATKLTRALGKFKPATAGTVKQALKWLDQQEAKGWGAFFEPLETLMAEEVDTVVLLSDGRPSRGRYDRDDRILAELPRVNRFRRLAIHTVLVGDKGADRQFMQDLAAATGGRYQQAGGK
ncbi:MAG: hypothetical protein O2894_01650 [Planctomycetota bacterium]|nr:hypothetical protein [Planctomycetota bacterium]